MSVVLLGSTSGSITLQEPAVAGTNTVNFGANTGVAILDANTPAFRNRIQNGDMRIDQRNAGTSVTPTSTGYTLDRWSYELTEASKMSVQQNAGSLSAANRPVGFTNYLGLTTVSAFAITNTSQFQLRQFVEGFNFADLMWGTANAVSATLSFWVRSSLTGTFGGSLRNVDSNRSYPFSYTISAANTWEQKSITISGDTTGTWNTTSDRGVGLFFGLGVGSTNSGTAGAWAAANYTSATGATSVVGTNGATFYITGVQLEKGSTATSFDYRSYGTELALCQRYYQLASSIVGAGNSTTQVAASVPFQVQMRGTPTLSTQGVIQLTDGTADFTQSATSISSLGTTSNGAVFFISNFTSLVANRFYLGPRLSANTNTVTLSAEL